MCVFWFLDWSSAPVLVWLESRPKKKKKNRTCTGGQPILAGFGLTIVK
jgi:hypothetical protein